MLRKISIKALVPGSRVANVLIPEASFSGPFFVLRTREDLQQLLSLGVKEVWVDEGGASQAKTVQSSTSLSEIEIVPTPPIQNSLSQQAGTHARDVIVSPVSSSPSLPETAPAVPEDVSPRTPTKRKDADIIGIDQEVVSLRGFYEKSFSCVQRLLEHTRESAEVAVGPLSSVVSHIMGSVQRNPDALLCMKTLQKADAYSFAHCVNVSTLAVVFGTYLGYNQENVRLLGLAGMLMDIGKQFVPAGIVNAPRRLNPDEMMIIQKHSRLGYEALQENEAIPEAVRLAVLEHHERLDGSGYPDGKKGGEISEMGLILAILDVYDALSSNRPYRKAIPPTEAMTTVYGMCGTAFDTTFTKEFIKCIGVYPAGSFVRLSNGEFGVVCENDKRSLNKPCVLAVGREGGRFLYSQARMINLEEHPTITIRTHLNPQDYNFDCRKALTFWSVLQQQQLTASQSDS